MKIALIADELTRLSIEQECQVFHVTPLNYRWVLRFRRPDFLLVESAWRGYRDSWKFKIAKYPDHAGRNNSALKRVVEHAKDMGIPTVFWNKEDGAHFDRFIDSAKLFDHIFTVDDNCIPLYREQVSADVTVKDLLFSVQPRIHCFEGFRFQLNSANFVGSYSMHVHPDRRAWQNLLFDSCARTGLGVSIFDRNSDRKSNNYRYPIIRGMTVYPAIPFVETAAVYRKILVSLNVNTVQNSNTMFSRRLVEILACGGIAITNPSPAVNRFFGDYCHVVNSADECDDLLRRLKFGPNKTDLERAEAGSRYVRSTHTWAHRLTEIRELIGH